MPRRTTVVLEDSSYKKLVDESIKRYGTARALSKVINSMVAESTMQSGEYEDILKVLSLRKVAKTTTKDFERDRKKLSTRFETRF